MASLYEVKSTTSIWMQDDRGLPVQGMEVYLYFPEFNEQHSFKVLRMDAMLIDQQAKQWLEQRRLLDELGRSTGHD